MALGLSPIVAIGLGAMMAPSSTACVLRLLTSRAEIDTVYGRNALGILLLQDIALVPLVLIVTFLGEKGTLGVILLEVGRAVGLLVLFFGGLYLIITYVISRIIDVMFATRNRELPVLLAATTCLGSTWVAHAFGLSPALGAFGAGLLLAESPFATQIRADIGGLRTLFVALFFVSIGMLADIGFMRSEWMVVVGFSAAIMVGKAVIIWPIARMFRHSHRNAIATGICLAQVGEFSFVLAQTGLSMGVIETDLFRLLVSATVITLFLSPLLVAASPRAAGWLDERLVGLGLIKATDTSPLEKEPAMTGHVIVVGMGPSGRGVVEALKPFRVPTVIVDLNSRAVMAARQEGFRAEVGDASQEEVLEHVHVKSARAVVVTVPDYRIMVQIIRQVRAYAPRTLVIARARYHVHADDLKDAGAHVIVDEERNMGDTLGRELIRRMDLASGVIIDEKEWRHP
jgi:CPA2 family monovalent cation:H+ antiporter-2